MQFYQRMHNILILFYLLESSQTCPIVQNISLQAVGFEISVEKCPSKIQGLDNRSYEAIFVLR